MEFKKCLRCGCFYVSDGDVCCNCQIKDKHDISVLSNFIQSNDINSINDLSIQTGIKENNINRFISNNIIKGFNKNEQ